MGMEEANWSENDAPQKREDGYLGVFPTSKNANWGSSQKNVDICKRKLWSGKSIGSGWELGGILDWQHDGRGIWHPQLVPICAKLLADASMCSFYST
jgi:hypothetical protein